MPVIHAVLFDYGLVLSAPPDPAAWARMKAILQADESSFHAAYWRPRYDYDLGILDGPAFWRTVAAELGRHLNDSRVRELLDADTVLWTQPNQPMIDWACSLQQAGIRTGILSNLGDEMEAGVLARCPWLQEFRHHTFSHRLRIAKPDPAIYRHALAGLGTAPEHTLFIDDRAENIAAARAAGIHAIQYTSHNSFLRELETAAFDALPLPARRAAGQSA